MPYHFKNSYAPLCVHNKRLAKTSTYVAWIYLVYFETMMGV